MVEVVSQTHLPRKY
jgi:Cna protein B-type domain